MPIGIQDFESLRTGGFVYVDKTAQVYRLANESRHVFLGRPRRFGKSLLVSTLKAYFLGKKELFGGLSMAELEKDWTEYPVFHLDLMGADYSAAEGLDSGLGSNLRPLEERWGRDPEEDNPTARFRGLIRRAYEQTSKKVVVLIDEYDRPLIQHIGDPAAMEEMRLKLASFYGVLKAADQYLRFALLTGVTKFAKVNVFSELNQLEDISMKKDYTGICGISETELSAYFEPELQNLAKENNMSYEETLEKMQKHYNGYHFSKNSEGMFNPFGVLNTFSRGEFGYYWYETGTPTILIKQLRENHFDLREFANGISVAGEEITNYRANSSNPVPLLYQSGYLTIKDFNSTLQEYILGFPNEEVKYAFLKNLMIDYLPDTQSAMGFSINDFYKDLYKSDIDAFMNRFKAFLGSIPYSVREDTEAYYQGLFYVMFSLMGQFVQAEVQSAVGRCDAVLFMDNKIMVFEFKLFGNGTVDDALQQIDDKGYLIPYTASGKQLFKTGAVLDREKRTLREWKTVVSD
ncbi:ATPase AAA [Spirochaetia bacterium]|nr:ATPase AAA [Spirochaetia bacterium]